ncbi:MAG: V-type ATP synthase subunit I [Clostridium sp.]|nr:V-type ATP synthase subunit I [Clostridium sp.]MCI7443261.1 V-type ATP synthase subunit I [Clostridium sp.]
MAIVKMKKFTLLAFESQRAELLEKLQAFAEVEFINLQDNDFLESNEDFKDLSKEGLDSEYAECEEKLSKAKFALNFLKEYVPQKSGLQALKEGKVELTLKELEEKVLNSNWEAIFDKVKEKEAEFNKLDNEKTKLQSTIDSLSPWENFDASFEELESLKIPKFLGSIPKQNEESLSSELENCYLEIVSSNNDETFFFVMCNTEQKEEIAEKLRALGFSQFKAEEKVTPLKTIHDSIDRMAKIDSEKFFIKEELADFDEEYKTLELVNEYYENMIVRKEATGNFLKTENVMVIQGWLAADDEKELINVVKKVAGDEAYLTFEDVKEDEYDKVPTKLKNNELCTCFESITEMYSTPKYDEIDPTPLLTPFYLLFFGMMVADMGYGLLMILATGFVLKKFKLDEGTRKFIKFFFYLGFPTIGFGAIYGAFFGDLIPSLPRLIDTNKDITTILILSIVLGAIQIFCGLGIKAYMLIKAGKPLDAFYDVGSWVITLISLGVVLVGAFVGGVPSIVKTIAIVLMIFGMVVIVLTNGRGAGSKAAELGQGAYALYGITSYVGDLVSYTRLMALGLAGGSLAGAFNMIIGLFSSNIVALILFGPLLFVFGHIFNLALSLLGAYVHTCRLQYVEYFGKFYEGGGRAFSPFKAEEKYINLKK